MKRAIITVKLVRCFSVGFTILSPKLNGACVEICLACFVLQLWSRGEVLFSAENYWRTWP